MSSLGLTNFGSLTAPIQPLSDFDNILGEKNSATQGAGLIGYTAGLYSALPGSVGYALDNFAGSGGAAAIGFNGQTDYPVGSIGWAAQIIGGIIPEWFGAVGNGTTDDTVAVQAAINAAAALTGPQYTDTMGQAPYGYGTSRRLKLSGKKYGISNTPKLAGNVGIYAEGGGFVALASFPAGAYMLDTGANPYCGRVNDLVLDGAGRNVKGINVQNAFMTRWRGLSVINTANDGIVVQATGPEFFLTDFDIAMCATPVAVTVAGLRVLGSDGNYSGGVIKYAPLGVVCNGGGNNIFTGVHPWGTYVGFRTYIPFWCVNSVRNTFVGCYADSPVKQDYTQAVSATVNGIPNGGVCFVFDSTSAQNQVIGGRGFINTTLWTAYTPAWSSATAYVPQNLVTLGGVTYCCILANTNQSPPNATYWTAIATNQFVLGYCAGQFNQFTSVNYNYAGNWLTDYVFSSDAIRDSCLVVGSPMIPAGMFAARLGMQATNTGASVRFVVANTDASANANSSAQTAYNVNGTDVGADVGVYGPSGVSYVTRFVNGVERHRSTVRGLELTGGNLIMSTATSGTAVGATEIGIGTTTSTVVGAAGGAAALPATPLGYITINVKGTFAKIPYYNN